jgi:hypothetical protein
VDPHCIACITLSGRRPIELEDAGSHVSIAALIAAVDCKLESDAERLLATLQSQNSSCDGTIAALFIALVSFLMHGKSASVCGRLYHTGSQPSALKTTRSTLKNLPPVAPGIVDSFLLITALHNTTKYHILEQSGFNYSTAKKLVGTASQ